MPPINYLSVFLGALASIVLGMFYYSDKFLGATWRREVGIDDKKMNSMKSKMGQMIVIMIFGSIFTAYVLASGIFFSRQFFTQMPALQVGISTGFWVFLGYVATYALTSVAYEGKSWRLYFINMGYQLSSYLLMGAIIGYYS